MGKFTTKVSYRFGDSEKVTFMSDKESRLFRLNIVIGEGEGREGGNVDISLCTPVFCRIYSYMNSFLKFSPAFLNSLTYSNIVCFFYQIVI